MKITFKLYASLSDYLPVGTQRHSVEIEVDRYETPNQILDRFSIPRHLAHLVLLNGVYLETQQRNQAQFAAGDILAVWPPVAGG